jgi:hypothetical protein
MLELEGPQGGQLGRKDGCRVGEIKSKLEPINTKSTHVNFCCH